VHSAERRKTIPRKLFRNSGIGIGGAQSVAKRSFL